MRKRGNYEPFGDGFKSEVYDLSHPTKNYAGEAEWIRQIVDDEGVRRGSLLDAACGTGKHLAYFNQTFDEVEGFDLSPSQLVLARRRIPGVSLHEGDLQTIRLDKEFGVVTCLFATINYMNDHGKLTDAVRTLTEHTLGEGLVIIQPTREPNAFGTGNYAEQYEVDGPNGEHITRNTQVGPFTGKEGPLRVDMDFIYTDANGKRHAFAERHDIGVYLQDTIAGMLEAAGAHYTYVEQPPEHLPHCEAVIVARM